MEEEEEEEEVEEKEEDSALYRKGKIQTRMYTIFDRNNKVKSMSHRSTICRPPARAGERVLCGNVILTSRVTQDMTSSEVGDGGLPQKISKPLNVRRLHRSQAGPTVTAQGKFDCGSEEEAITLHLHQTKTKARWTTAAETKRTRMVMMLRTKEERKAIFLISESRVAGKIALIGMTV